MAHFYGTIQGHRGEASRLGSKKSGLQVQAASWQGRVTVTLYEQDGIDMARVDLSRHVGAGTDRVLYRGPVSGSEAAVLVDRSRCHENPCTCHDETAWTRASKARGVYPEGCSCGCTWANVEG